MPFEQQFWDDEFELLFAVMLPEITEIFGEAVAGSLAAIQFGIDVDFDLINDAARAFAQGYSFELVSKLTDSTRDQLQDMFSDWIESGKPLPDLIARAETLFTPVRAQMVAETETTRIYAESNMRVWEASGVVAGKRWHTVFDDKVCEICEPMHLDAEILAVPFIGGDGDEHMNPPAHVRCRCFLTPVMAGDI